MDGVTFDREVAVFFEVMRRMGAPLRKYGCRNTYDNRLIAALWVLREIDTVRMYNHLFCEDRSLCGVDLAAIVPLLEPFLVQKPSAASANPDGSSEANVPLSATVAPTR